MNREKQIIEAISFMHKGERLVVKSNILGKFKVPVTEVINGQLKTRVKNLTAREVIEHDIIKNCDPTLYLSSGERRRVFQGGDSSYLPAQVDGILQKHDKKNAPKLPKLKKRDSSLKGGLSRQSYEQASLDMYGWYPDESGHAD